MSNPNTEKAQNWMECNNTVDTANLLLIAYDKDPFLDLWFVCVDSVDSPGGKSSLSFVERWRPCVYTTVGHSHSGHMVKTWSESFQHFAILWRHEEILKFYSVVLKTFHCEEWLVFCNAHFFSLLFPPSLASDPAPPPACWIHSCVLVWTW